MTATLPKSVRVKGLAVPFGVPNSYNETLAPGALNEFMALVKARGGKLPMGFMHEMNAGTWDKLEVKPDGLYVEGEITEPYIIEFLDENTHGTFTGELSITFAARDNAPGKWRETRERFNSRDPWEQTHAPRGLELADTVTTHKAWLTEISLVNRGAFPGTYFTPVKPLAI